MRWRGSAAFAVFFVSAAASAHWWAAGDHGLMTATLVGGAVGFVLLLASSRPESALAAGPAQAERLRRVYRRVAPFYDGFRAVWSRYTRPVEHELDRLFQERIDTGARVLELGTGTGINIGRLLRIAPDFGSYLGIDVSQEMLARARKRAREDPRIEVRIGDATDLSALAGPFDFIVSTWLLSHLDAPADAVRGALAKLAPNGTAVFVFFTAPDSALLRAAFRTAGGAFSYRLVDRETLRKLPGLTRMTPFAGGTATLAEFEARAPLAPSTNAESGQ